MIRIEFHPEAEQELSEEVGIATGANSRPVRSRLTSQSPSDLSRRRQGVGPKLASVNDATFYRDFHFQFFTESRTT